MFKRSALSYPPALPAKKRIRQKFPYFLFSLCLFCIWLVYTSLIPNLPQVAEPPRFYSNQAEQDLRQVLIEAMNQARSSIYLVMFGLSDKTVLSTLSHKIQEGITTTVYYDPGNTKNIRALLEGGNIHPVRTKGLMHHKILIIDDATVFMGSANMTTHSLRMHDNLMVGFVNRTVAQFLQEHTPNSSGHLRTMIGGQEVEFWLLPDNRGHALNALCKKIRSAYRSIQIAIFTLTHKVLVEELIRAHKRGVKVTLVVDMHSGLGASVEVVEQLKTAGVRLLFSQGTQLLHHKFALIDDRILVMGSANWTKSAFTKNCDSLVMFDSLTEEQKQYMITLWRKIETEAKLQLRDHLVNKF